MKKILLSLMVIATVSGLVGGTAYALFSDKVQATGITLATGNADLQVGLSNESLDNQNLNLSGIVLNDLMYPGYGLDNSKKGTFYLGNKSSSAISLQIKAQLPSGGVKEDQPGSWEALKYAVEIAVNRGGASTGWHSLADWNSAPIAFPGAAISPGEVPAYDVYVRIPKTYSSGPLKGNEVGNEISGKFLSGVTFDIVGTQAN